MNKKIILEDKKTLISFQEEFNAVFPFLRIDFFVVTKTTSSGNKTLKLIEKNNQTFEDIRKKGSTSIIQISPQTIVSDLENQIENEFLISAQVYRSSGRMWLETTLTDSWTLEEQNKQGESLSNK